MRQCRVDRKMSQLGLCDFPCDWSAQKSLEVQHLFREFPLVGSGSIKCILLTIGIVLFRQKLSSWFQQQYYPSTTYSLSNDALFFCMNIHAVHSCFLTRTHAPWHVFFLWKQLIIHILHLSLTWLIIFP